MTSEILKNILAVGAGSCLGGIARYLISISMKGAGKGFPWGTLTVNLIGCLLIGLLWGYFSKTATEGTGWALFLTIGLCGGFTTFSTFSKEALVILQSGNVLSFALYLAVSILAGIALVAAGCYMIR